MKPLQNPLRGMFNMTVARFTKNKQTVRDLQGELINKYFKNKLGKLKYFGLPSDEMKDIIDWKALFAKCTAAERGVSPDFWERQHFLMVSAFKMGILSKTVLLRGDIDGIILNGKDDAGKEVDYPFDVVSLDYSGGLLYRDNDGEQYRLKSIKKLIGAQARQREDYLLFISTNLDNSKDAEVKRTIENIRTELLRYGTKGEEVINNYLNHKKDEARLKIYIPYFVNQVSAAINYTCETNKVIFYLGNNNTRMMNFRFYLKYDSRTTTPRFPKERLSQIINSPMIEIKNGKYKEVSLGLPKLRRV